MVAQATLIPTTTTTEGTKGTKRFKCPVHHGKNLSVAVGFINGRAWAKCWSHGCSQSDILAALGITNTQSIPWTPPPPRPRPTISIKPLPPVTPVQALDYLKGIGTPAGAQIAYQRDDGLMKSAYRAGKERWTTKGMTGDGWQLRRFDPADPASAQAVALAEGEKDAAILAAAGLIAFTAPRGAQSLPQADFTELVDLGKDTHLPVLLCGDNDVVGREAMRKVRGLLKMDHHLDAIDTTSLAQEKGSVADLPRLELQKLLGLLLKDVDERMVKPVRSRKMYREFWCPRPKPQRKAVGDEQKIMSFLPCGNTATCQKCCAWENYLHIERCWRGKSAQMVVVSGFGGADSTTAETTGLAKVYRGRWEDRLRENPAVDQYKENPTSERRGFLTALAVGDDYRAALTMFLSHPLSDKQIGRERRRAGKAGLGFEVKDVVTREDIEDAAPKSLSIRMEGVGTTGKTNTWTSSGWPTWWEPETTYAFGDGVDLEEGEEFPPDSISERDWKREYHQIWDGTKTLKDNLVVREEDAYFNAVTWMTPCHGLSIETLQGIAEGGDIPALIEEVGDYKGPTALLVDAAAWLTGRKEWRKAFRPVLDAAGWVEG